MNPGPIEEGGKAVTGIIETFKTQPFTLALVILNLALLGLLWYALRYTSELRANEFKMIFENNKEVQALLSRCVVPKED